MLEQAAETGRLDTKLFDLMSDGLVEEGAYIWNQRNKAFSQLLPFFEQTVKTLWARKPVPTLGYERETNQENQQALEKEYRELLASKNQQERARARTASGPHLDDLLLFCDEDRFCGLASRGEMRTIVIATKLAEVRLAEQVRRDKPVLLLDDVFSELDHKHSERLRQEFSGYQVFVTTTEPNLFGEHQTAQDRKFLVKDGKFHEQGKET